MRNIMKAIRKFMLRKQVKICQLRINKLTAMINKRYHKVVLDMAIRGENEVLIDNLELFTDGLETKRLELISMKYNFKRELMRVC